MNLPEELEVLIITLSDRASKGEYEDLSGPRIRKLVSEYFEIQNIKCSVTEVLIPDDSEELREIIHVSGAGYNIIFTTGGTGIGPRDITVETIKPLLTREIPGIMEYIRIKYGSEKPHALLSRGVAGLIGKTLVYTLPGSVRAVNEYMEEILKTLLHSLQMLYGIDSHNKS
ncbi:MAG: molybdenum cofactor biosynthesis protein [Odoribacter sp.]|nr:molybdenum cofactor biosynthesis protein [Odoribacter sp.]